MESASVEDRIATIYVQESRRILATLVGLLHGNFDLAEDALHDAFVAALSQWKQNGIPENPFSWLVSAGRFKAIDRIRRQSRLNRGMEELARTLEQEALSHSPHADLTESIEDDRLRLIFTCCHPGLALQARIALTLREVCGLDTTAIASAFRVPVPTLAQRIVRAKNKIREAGIPYEVPEPRDLAQRLDAVLHVIYLVFNEGYCVTTGTQLVRSDLSSEAIRLGRLLHELLPDAQVMGLLALMLLHDARREGRVSASGDLIPLEEQDRSLWNKAQIREGCGLVTQALQAGPPGEYVLQAAIAALHAEAPCPDETDWVEITGLYDLLLRINPSPVVRLNRAVALAMRDGACAGLAEIDTLIQHTALRQHHLTHAARADLFRRVGLIQEAQASYRQALALVQQDAERRFLQRRIDELKS